MAGGDPTLIGGIILLAGVVLFVTGELLAGLFLIAVGALSVGTGVARRRRKGSGSKG